MIVIPVCFYISIKAAKTIRCAVFFLIYFKTSAAFSQPYIIFAMNVDKSLEYMIKISTNLS